MFNLLLILGIILGALLILIVVIQNPKGGGIASNFTGGSQLLGVQKTNEFVEKVTWSLASALVVIVLVGSFMGRSGTDSGIGRSILQDDIEQDDLRPTDQNTDIPTQAPTEIPTQGTPAQPDPAN